MGGQLATIGTALPGGVPLDDRIGRLGLGVLGGEGGLNVVEREVQLILADLLRRATEVCAAQRAQEMREALVLCVSIR